MLIAVHQHSGGQCSSVSTCSWRGNEPSHGCCLVTLVHFNWVSPDGAGCVIGRSSSWTMRAVCSVPAVPCDGMEARRGHRRRCLFVLGSEMARSGVGWVREGAEAFVWTRVTLSYCFCLRSSIWRLSSITSSAAPDLSCSQLLNIPLYTAATPSREIQHRKRQMHDQNMGWGGGKICHENAPRLPRGKENLK